MKPSLPRALPVVAALSLGACAMPGGAPAGSGGAPPAKTASSYFAMGTEPGWTLEITPQRLNYAGDYGAKTIAVANPGARPSFNGERYVSDRLSVDITHSECNDGMSDRRFADTVTVTADGVTQRGCGGAILPPASLAGTRWTIVSIGGTPVASDTRTEVMFDGKRMAGTAGCNRFTGPYASDGKRLTAGALASTRMACMGPGGDQENAFFALLATPISLRFTPEGQMILMGERGKSAVLKPMI